MIDPKNEYTDDQLLDLLVDSELDESRRREVIRALETEPGGWKRCALAFLEAQKKDEQTAVRAGRITIFREYPGSRQQLEPVGNVVGHFAKYCKLIIGAATIDIYEF